MLTRIDIRRFKGLELSDEVQSLHFPDSSGAQRPFILKDVQGLGPVKSDIATSPMASDDGEYFLSASSGGRNVVMTVELNPNYKNSQTVADLRRRIQSVAPPGEHVVLTFIFDDRETLATNGWVEVNEPTIFSSSTDIQISVVCIQTHLQRDSRSVTISNPTSGFLIDYTDVKAVGFQLSFRMSADVTLLSLKRTDSTSAMSMGELKNGDRLNLNTQPGSKSLRLNRAGVSGDALTLLKNKTVWFDLNRDKTNFFWFEEGGSAVRDAVITYIPLEIGV